MAGPLSPLPLPEPPLTDGVIALRSWPETDAAAVVEAGRDQATGTATTVRPSMPRKSSALHV